MSTEAIWWVLHVISAVGPFIAVAALIYTAKALQLNRKALEHNHLQGRRQYAANIGLEWNRQTGESRREIEKLMPGLINAVMDTRGKIKNNQITQELAKAIYHSKPDVQAQLTNWQLRSHFITMLNYFEFIAVAWHKHIGDRQMIEDSCKETMLWWYGVLNEYIKYAATQEKKPWHPLTLVVAEWRKQQEDKLPEESPLGAP